MAKWLVLMATPVEIRERCVNRRRYLLLGKTDAASLAKVSVTDPQSSVDTLLTDPDFQERFSRFINARFNTTVGANSAEDASYHMMKYILSEQPQWKDMFVGQFGVAQVNQGGQNVVQVQADPNGLGYFRSKAWLDRYAGNELTGMKLSTAYRIEHNVLGLESHHLDERCRCRPLSNGTSGCGVQAVSLRWLVCARQGCRRTYPREAPRQQRYLRCFSCETRAALRSGHFGRQDTCRGDGEH